MNVNYNQTHPLYLGAANYYRKCAMLYDGGEAVNNSLAKMLTQHPHERDKHFHVRIKRAAYKNYAAPTVDLFSSSIVDKVVRDGFERVKELEPLLLNCDRMRNPPSVFFKNIVTKAASVGAHFVLVDMPKANGQALTLEQANQQGLFPFFVNVPAVNVVDWGYEQDGTLSYVVIQDSYYNSPGPFEPHKKTDTLTVWTKNTWQRFESVQGQSFELVCEGEHPVGAVPLVPFLYERATNMTGYSVIDDVIGLVVRVYNQDSELDKMLFDAALPLLVAFGFGSEDEAERVIRSTDSLWTISRGDSRVEYIEPSGNSFAAKRQQILDDVEAIREISLRQTKPRGAQVESAEAKRYDTIQLASQLAEFARRSAASERVCWEYAAAWLGIQPIELKDVNIKYNEEFDPEALKEKLSAIYMELFKEGAISRTATIKQILGWNDTEVEEDAAVLEEEKRSTQGPSGSLTELLQQRINNRQ